MSIRHVVRQTVRGAIRSVIGGAGGFDPLVLLAAAPDPDTYEMGLVTGIGDISETSTSTRYHPDHESVWRPYGSTVPAYTGGRTVTNLFANSSDLTDAVWNTAGTVTVTGGETDPVGGSDAFRLQGSGTWLFFDGASANGSAVVLSCWVKSNTGSSQTFRFMIDGIVLSSNLTATTSWKRFSFSYTSFDGNGNHGIIRDSSDNAVDLLVYGIQFEDSTGRSETGIPSEYVATSGSAVTRTFASTNGNSVVSNTVVEAAGTPFTAANMPWLTAQPAATNSLLYSNDQTQWTETGTSVAAKDAVGLTGAANTACTLTDNDGSSLEYVRQGVVIPSDTNTHVLRCWVKSDEDETRFPEIALKLNDADSACYLGINTKTGAGSTRYTAGTTDYEINAVGDWWEVLISVQNASRTTADVQIRPANGTTLGGINNAATGSIVVANAELHLASSIAAVRGSSPIYTTSSTVSVVANGTSADDEPHPSEGGYFVEWQPQFATSEASGNIELLSLDDNAGLLYYDADNSLLKSTDGTNTASVALTVAAGTTYKCWVAYGGTSLQVGVNATTGTAGTFDGAFATGTKIEFVTPSAATSLVRNIRAYSQPFAAAVTTLQGLASA